MTAPPLAVYLHDHLSGAAAGVELARRLTHQFIGHPAELELRELVSEIEADRDTLVVVLERLALDRSRFKEAMGWVGEKVARVKLGRVGRKPELARFMGLEILGLGIAGKLELWGALDAVFTPDELGGLELSGLRERAEAQRGVVERLRLEAARTALQG